MPLRAGAEGGLPQHQDQCQSVSILSGGDAKMQNTHGLVCWNGNPIRMDWLMIKVQYVNKVQYAWTGLLEWKCNMHGLVRWNGSAIRMDWFARMVCVCVHELVRPAAAAGVGWGGAWHIKISVDLKGNKCS